MQDNLLRAMNLRSPRWARNPILAGYRGSYAHGTYIPPEDVNSTDDVDVFGVVVHKPVYYHGIDSYAPNYLHTFVSAGETLDIEIHEIRKFVTLLGKGNPNINQHLWLERSKYFVIKRSAMILIQNRREFLSQRMLLAFAGYAFDQFYRMEKFEKRGYMGTKREELVKKYGYDIKNASHLLRLMYQGIKLAQDCEIVPVLAPYYQEDVIAVKQGKWSLEQVKERALILRQLFDEAVETCPLPERVSHNMLNQICQKVIESEWEDLDV